MFRRKPVIDQSTLDAVVSVLQTVGLSQSRPEHFITAITRKGVFSGAEHSFEWSERSANVRFYVFADRKTGRINRIEVVHNGHTALYSADELTVANERLRAIFAGE